MLLLTGGRARVFQVTIGHQTIVMAGSELSSVGDNRKETGNSFFAVVQNKQMQTFEEVIRKYVRRGQRVSSVFLDESSY